MSSNNKNTVTKSLDKETLIKFLSSLINLNDTKSIDKEIKNLIESISKSSKNDIVIPIRNNDQNFQIKNEFLKNELEQILNSRTIERKFYYIKRLIKTFNEIKTNKINDINLNLWKEYDDILTDSLWIFDKRDRAGAHNAEYWGNFIPQIPNQLLRRFTKLGDWVLDPFLGSGTTLIECKRLGRNGIGVELSKDVVKLANENISNEANHHKVKIEVINADSTELDYELELNKRGIKSIQFLIMHPPYWDIIKFSNSEKDLSNAKTSEEFLNFLGKVVDKTYKVLDNGRYFALVIGDKYSKGEWIPLAFYSMNEVLKRGYKLKSIIVKNFEETRAKMQQKELWRYRALVGGFYIFKHEYVFLFQKSRKRGKR
ncbi:MAG: DNA methyltransferase [Ignavibacterium sp.]|nr:DNA methyltransferase [Ignavibacterium sp.]MDW8374173.1 DNA methyltransferase [Ignavibacteriales bacterium]